MRPPLQRKAGEDSHPKDGLCIQLHVSDSWLRNQRFVSLKRYAAVKVPQGCPGGRMLGTGEEPAPAPDRRRRGLLLELGSP